MTYNSPNRGIDSWWFSWLLHGRENGSSPRYRLATELKYIRRAHDNQEAKRFRDSLIFIGSYPVQKRKLGR